MQAAVLEWLGSLPAKQDIPGSNLGLAASISEIMHLLFPNRVMTEIFLEQLKFMKQNRSTEGCS